jgi:hypothetical protein
MVVIMRINKNIILTFVISVCVSKLFGQDYNDTIVNCDNYINSQIREILSTHKKYEGIELIENKSSFYYRIYFKSIDNGIMEVEIDQIVILKIDNLELSSTYLSELLKRVDYSCLLITYFEFNQGETPYAYNLRFKW